MSRFTWDNAGEKMYELGDKNGVLYPNYVAASKRFEGGVPWNGLTAVTESPSGAEANTMYADDIKYGEIRSAEEFGATIEAYTYPDEWAECDGSKALGTNGGMLIGQQKRKPFGFSYVSTVGNDADGMDHGYKLHLIYNATASPSEKSYATINDSPEAITFSWELTTTPVAIDNLVDNDGKPYKPTAIITIDSTKVDKTALNALEDILYDKEAAYLPTPYEVYSILFGEVGVGVTGLGVAPSTMSLAVGKTGKAQATIYPVNAGNKQITCESSNGEVATVENSGTDITVTAVTAGNASITVTSVDNASATDTIAVTVTSE